MIEKSCDVAVIGGGPAGIAAAANIADGGASVVLLDHGTNLGGHYYKPLPDSFEGKYTPLDRTNVNELQKWASLLATRQVELLDQAEVWGIFKTPINSTGETNLEAGSNGKYLFSVQAEHPTEDLISIHTKAIVLAPGVYDRPLPFPGWELPGVTTPGAVQMMLKKQGLLPGKRVLVCGTGPLLMVVAASLVEEGVEVAALLDTCGIFDGMTCLPGALGGLRSRMREAFQSATTLAYHRVPFLFNHAIFQALGNADTGVTGAIIGKINEIGSPVPASEKEIEVDSICCGYGFIPSIALTLHLGCRHIYDPNLGANIPWHDERMRTSVPSVLVAGDVTGVGGKPLAVLQGKLAGLSALEELHYLTEKDANQQRNQLSGAVRREERFSRWLWHRYQIKEGLLDLANDETLICRCENVRLGEIRQSLADGARDLYGIKLRTRLGMGSCQGRYCMTNAAMLISKQTGCPVEDLGIQSVRPPVFPVRLKHIAGEYQELFQEQGSILEE